MSNRVTTLGVGMIAGPVVRMTEGRMVLQSDALLNSAKEMAAVSLLSAQLRKRVASQDAG